MHFRTQTSETGSTLYSSLLVVGWERVERVELSTRQSVCIGLTKYDIARGLQKICRLSWRPIRAQMRVEGGGEFRGLSQ